MGRKKVKQFSAPGSKTSSIPLKNPEGVRGGVEAQKESQEQGTVVGGGGRRYIMGRWGIRGLETRVGRESSVSRGGARLHSGGIHVGGVRGGGHSDSAGGGSSRSESCLEL